MTDLTEQQLAEGWVRHDGGPCPSGALMAQVGQILAIYRGRPDKPAKLFIPALEQWIWREDNPLIDIIAYKPETPNG